MAVGEIYKGEEFIYLVELKNGNGTTLVRPFDQTGGGTSLETDEIEIDTKDRSGSSHGKVTESISLEGNITEGDPFPKAMKKMIRAKEYVKIYEIDTRTNEGEYGMYMVSSFDLEHENGDNSTYSLEGTLFGTTKEVKLDELPEGAPPLEGMEDDENDDGNETP
ncbi:phage major tail protein, TP901-1 family [Oceanobacillus neutriphilus]|uniref:Phage major tail protein, TP901-1 family n=1 Tax=Oceanobacillus neutriphilus TaxID=531815 RepID=A0ABQ2NYA0_9BACI|nr:phage major tail protein, TP901-1 family [Oceanobacillus neutriphilus]GGP13568.1 phage major tail protein, TP901-1 family [Oceanobacillus neutriphilus]